MKIIDLENIRIPSINRKFIKTGVLAPEYRACKEMLRRNCFRNTKIKGPYKVEIYIDTYKDIDNGIKMIIDAVAAAGVIDNDKNINKLIISRKPIKKGQMENLIVTVESLSEK